MESNLAVKIGTTMPAIQAQVPILGHKYDKEAKYVWRTGKSFFLSKRQTIVVETFIKTRNIAECRRALLRDMGRAPSYSTVFRLLQMNFIKDHIAERMEELGIYAGWTKERWFKVMTDHLRGNSEYIAASEDLKMNEDTLSRMKDDANALIGKVNCRKRMIEAGEKRLAPGDLSAMNLVGKIKGWGHEGGVVFNQDIKIVQADGRV